MDVSIDKLPYDDNFFDIILSEHVVEHMFRASVPFHFGEVYRVLKPGGKYTVKCPNLKPAAIAYVNNDKSFFEHCRKGTGFSCESMYLPGDSIGEWFMRWIVSEGEDTFVYSRDGREIGSLAHQWGYDYEQFEILSRQIGFSEIECNYDVMKDVEINVDFIK